MYMIINLNIKPLSVNQAWQGRRYKTQKYIAYEEEMLYALRGYKTIRGKIKMDIFFYLKNAERIDIDNCVKPLLDCLVKKGIIEDDRKIVELHLYKKKSVKDNICIEISPVDNSGCVIS